MLDESVIREVLRTHWALDVDALVPRPEAMNSRVWVVERTDGRRAVVKAVPRGTGLPSGLAVARAVQDAGIPTGAAQAAVDGRPTVIVEGWDVALLTYVAGRPLDASHKPDAVLWGTALGEAHQVLVSQPVPVEAERWPWDWPDASADHLDALPDVRTLVGEAVESCRRRVGDRRPTMGLLHADPDPGSFLVDDSGSVGIIDWGGAVWGPLLYDVASAVVLQHLTGSPGRLATFLHCYEVASPLSWPELELLDEFVRLRWAVQAWWFAWRLAHDNRLGLDSPDGNRFGLEAAIDALR
ncbi:MAG TPA: phosphotransferase [Actinopolymorphaceae bacterium]